MKRNRAEFRGIPRLPQALHETIDPDPLVSEPQAKAGLADEGTGMPLQIRDRDRGGLVWMRALQ